jgi:hypothetical protein
VAPLSADLGSVLAEADIVMSIPAVPPDTVLILSINTGQYRDAIPAHPKDFYLLC